MNWKLTFVAVMTSFSILAQIDSLGRNAEQYLIKPVCLELGFSAYPVNGTVMLNYFVASNWKRNTETKWTNEFSLYVHEENPFSHNYYGKLSLHTLNYGKGYELKKKHLLFKPSVGVGVHYLRQIDFFKGYQYNVGIQINPRVQYGFDFKSFRISLVTEAFMCLSYYQYFFPNGQNANPNLRFPIDYTGRMFTNLTITYKFN